MHVVVSSLQALANTVMSKPRGRPARFTAPEASQISALRRAMDVGHMEQARQRLAALRNAFPGFKPLLGLAWELEDRADEPMRAAAHAYAWHGQAPGSHAALHGLCKSALAAGLVAVHARAQRRLLALDGHPLPGPEPVIHAPLGVLTLEQAEAIDLSRMHMALGDAAAAVAVLQGVDHPSARNNLALALADRGDFAAALRLTEANWQVLPANLYALGMLVRLRCRAEGMERCQGFVAPLRQTQALRVEDAIAQVAALLFLGESQAARQAWEATAGAPFWADASTRQREVFDTLGNPGAGLPDGHDLWFASPWFNAMVAISRDARSGDANDSPSPDENVGAAQRWDAQIDACDAHTDYLLRATELGDELVRHMALAVLKRRAQKADGSALAALRRRLTLPSGPDQMRIGLLNWLASRKLVESDVPVDTWFEGRLVQVQSHGAQITNEPRASPFPPEGTALHVRVHELIGRNDLHEALDLALQLQGMYPAEPTALINLAAIKERLGRPLAEFSEDYRRAHAMAPDHLIARFGLARCLALQGQLPEGRALLASDPRDQAHWHLSEYLGLLHAQHALAVAGGQHELARNTTAMLDDVQRHFSA